MGTESTAPREIVRVSSKPAYRHAGTTTENATSSQNRSSTKTLSIIAPVPC